MVWRVDPTRGLGYRHSIIIQAFIILGLAFVSPDSLTAQSLNKESNFPLFIFGCLSAALVFEYFLYSKFSDGVEPYPRLTASLYLLWGFMLIPQAWIGLLNAPGIWPLWCGYIALALTAFDFSLVVVKKWQSV